MPEPDGVYRYRGYVPKRSNDFQRLIAMLMEVLEDAEVEESKEFSDPDNSEMRETDIYVRLRGLWGGRDIRIALECVDRKRKRDTPWVEMIGMRYQRLKVADVVLLVSSSGFYKPAIQKAEALGMRAITPTVTKRNLSGHIDGSLEGQGLAGDFKTGLTVGMMEYESMGLRTYPSAVGTWDGIFTRADGSELINGMELAARQIAAEPELMRAMYEGGENRFVGEFDEPTHEDEPLYARVVSADGESESLVRAVYLHYVVTVSMTNRGDMAQTEIIDFEGIKFGTGTSVIGGEPARMVVTESPDGQSFNAITSVNYEVKPRTAPAE